MPIMGGIELINTLQNDDNYKSLPVIISSSDSEKNKIMAVIKAGAKTFLPKPLVSDTVLSSIEKATNLKLI
jgi:two-component system, chemotaxis family, chemotaxis protein CheY